MKFTEAQFLKAVEMLQSVEFPTTGRRDKRRANRTEIRTTVQIKLCDKDDCQWSSVLLRDVSPRGAKLQIPFAIQPNDSFLLRLPHKDGIESQPPLICRVAHCTANKESFIIGAEFTGRQTPQVSAADAQAELDRIRQSILG